MSLDWRVVRGPRLDHRPFWELDDPFEDVVTSVVRVGPNFARVRYRPGPHGYLSPWTPNDLDPSFVLVHGIGVSSRYFIPLARKLSRIGDVYLIDLPGYAALPRPRQPLSISGFAAVVDVIVGGMTLNDPIFIGHSMGAQVVTELLVHGVRARRHRHEAAAVLVGPPVNVLERHFPTQLWRFATSSLHEPPAVRAIATRAYLSSGLTWFFEVMPSMMRYPIEDRIRQLPCPVTILRGEYDHLAPPGWVEFLGSRAGADIADPRAGLCRHVTVPGAAHSVIYDHDTAVLDAVVHLMEDHPPAGEAAAGRTPRGDARC